MYGNILGVTPLDYIP